MQKSNLMSYGESARLSIERIQINDLPQLAGLYDQLVEEKTDRDRMKGIFAKMDKCEDYYLLGAKTENQLLGLGQLWESYVWTC